MKKYGRQHQEIREALLPFAIGKPCHLCGELMEEGQALDLDHKPDGNGYRGFTHAECNRRDGGRRGNRRLRGRRRSREW